MAEAALELPTLTRKDFVSDQEVRWCPGCGDYAILAQMQKVLPDLGIAKEKIVSYPVSAAQVDSLTI